MVAIAWALELTVRSSQAQQVRSRQRAVSSARRSGGFDTEAAAVRLSAIGRPSQVALAAVGLEGVHVHDLRHTGNQLIATVGEAARAELAKSKACNFSEPSGTQRARNRRATAEDAE
jgi:hypothetical protein